MIRKLFISVTIMALLGIAFYGCSSEEYTTAKLAIQQKEWDRAEEFLLKSLVVEPENAEIPYQLGEQVYARNSDWVKMNEMFERALAINPDQVILAGSTVRDYVSNSRERYWVASYNNAVNLFKKVNDAIDDVEREEFLQTALVEFQTAAAIYPTKGQTYASMATLYLDMEDSENALKQISKAAELEPENARILTVAGQIYSRKDNLEEAAKYFKKALELEPNNTSTIRSLASVYYESGDVDGAIITYESAISKETNSEIKSDLYFNLGVLYNQAGDFFTAEENFMIALDLNPDDIEAIIGMAQVFENAEKWHQAEKFFKQLMEIDPDNPNHYKGMARVLLRQGKQDDAQYYYEKSKKVGN